MSSTASLRDQVSPAEWQARVDLAACYRLVARFGWDDLVFTHISARVPGTEHDFLINPYGLLFEEITASSLVKIDLDGKKLLPSPYEINPAGFTIHSAIHAARPAGGVGAPRAISAAIIEAGSATIGSATLNTRFNSCASGQICATGSCGSGAAGKV